MVIVRKSALVVTPVLAAGFVTGCGASQHHAAASSANAGGNAVAACKALAAWENGPATDTLNQDPARAKIAQLGAGTKFGADFNTWMNDPSGASQTVAAGNQVDADCASLGVTVLSGSASTPTAGQGAAGPSAPASSGLSASDQQFVSDMQSTFNFGSGVQDSDIASFGEQVCSALGTGASIASQVPTAQQAWTNTSPGDAIQMIVLAEKDICPAEQSAQTVTYVVTGSYADVTYGPSGSDNQGTVPMSVTQPLGSPQYYAINAQLQGGGSVSCQIKVDSVTIASASASGGYNIADCEIDQNSTVGSWENTNSAG